MNLDLLTVDKSNIAKLKTRYIDNIPHYDWKSTTPLDMTITLKTDRKMSDLFQIPKLGNSYGAVQAA